MCIRDRCGSDRILLQNALNTLLQPEAPVRQPEPQPAAQPVRPAAPAEEPTRIVGAAQEEATRIIPPRAAEPAPGIEIFQGIIDLTYLRHEIGRAHV